MKKLFVIMMALAVAVTSCDPKGFTYNADVTGDADGNVSVTMPDGYLNLEGEAVLDFHYGNDTSAIYTFSFEEAFASPNKKIVKSATRAQKYTENFDVTSASGTYDIYMNGYVREPITGMKFEFDKRFTNRDTTTTVAVADSVAVTE